MLGAAMLWLTTVAQAQSQTADTTEQMFSFSAYGTVGLAHSSEKKADFIANDLQLRGAGRNANWSAEVDSRIGAQMTAKFTPQLSGIVQITSEQRYDGSYRPEIEWLNVKYDVTPDLSIRAGRIVLPFYLQSDSRKVGYAIPWVRPPVEVYSLIPLTRSDGMDLNWRSTHGNLINSVQVAYGRSSIRIPEDEVVGGKVTARKGFGVTDTVEYGNASLRASFFTTEGSISAYEQLINGYRSLAGALSGINPALAAQSAALASKYDPMNKTWRLFTVGASYDPGKWFVMGEYGVVDTDSIYGKRAGWHLTGGYRVGKWTPYLTYAQALLKSNASDSGLNVPAAYGPYATAASGLNAALNRQLANAPVQNTISVGVRWDVAKNMALKAQYDYTQVGKGSPGSLDHQIDGEFNYGGKYRVFSVVLDFLL